MTRELDAERVARRLAALRGLYVAERADEARRRLERERPTLREPFEQCVARRLAELRALCELADYVHARARTPGERG